MISETTRIFNSAIGASAIAASFELGLFDEIHQNDPMDIEAYSAERGVSTWSIASILQVLHRFDIVRVSDDLKTATRGPEFDDAFANKGYFLWLMRGYGNLLQNLATIVEEGNCTTDGIGRDGKYIAMAGRDYGAQFVDPHFTKAMDEEPFTVAADLGCGSAQRLMSLAMARPDFRGVGVEVNKGAVDLARRSIKQAGLQDRVQVVHFDVKNLVYQPEFEEVEVLFCFFMGHDLWPRPNCLEAFRSIRESFPQLKRFLFSDTYRSDLPYPGQVPIFTLGFEFTHNLMGQYIPSVAEWQELFTEAGWTCHGQHDLSIPYSAIFDLRPTPGSADR
jgi:hypothetical protein